MSANKNDRLADQINKEPVVYMDCTGQEIMAAFVIALLSGLTLGIFLGILLGLLMLGLIFGMILSLAISWLLLNYIAKSRNQHYETWLTERIFLIKRSLSLSEKPFIADHSRFSRGAR